MLTYRRKCKSSPCFWEDDVDRKFTENPIDYRKDSTYECPECGKVNLEIELKDEGKIWQIWTPKGCATFDPRFWDAIIDKYKEEPDDKTTAV
jgi:hypothetical protein